MEGGGGWGSLGLHGHSCPEATSRPPREAEWALLSVLVLFCLPIPGLSLCGGSEVQEVRRGWHRRMWLRDWPRSPQWGCCERARRGVEVEPSTSALPPVANPQFSEFQVGSCLVQTRLSVRLCLSFAICKMSHYGSQMPYKPWLP